MWFAPAVAGAIARSAQILSLRGFHDIFACIGFGDVSFVDFVALLFTGFAALLAASFRGAGGGLVALLLSKQLR